MAKDLMLLPATVISRIRSREFENIRNLKEHLSGDRNYPLVFRFGLPSAAAVKELIADRNFIISYQEYFRAWNGFKHRDLLRFESKKWGLDGCESVPEALEIRNFPELRLILSPEQNKFIDTAIERAERLSEVTGADCPEIFYRLLPLFAGTTGNGVEYSLSDCEFEDLLIIIPQLKRNRGGEQLYLRALPLVHIDTKFIENHDRLLLELLKTVNLFTDADELPDADAIDKLGRFLGVVPRPGGYVNMVVLDPELVGDSSVTGRYRQSMLPINELKEHAPVGKNILIVENKDSGFMLPELKDTVAIFGGGKNVAWAANSWLSGKNKVAYWGDLDQSGFRILSDIRLKAGFEIPSLMMDLSTIELHRDRMCADASGETVEPREAERLTSAERDAADYLAGAEPSANRLEQEKLDQDYVLRNIREFFSS